MMKCLICFVMGALCTWAQTDISNLNGKMLTGSLVPGELDTYHLSLDKGQLAIFNLAEYSGDLSFIVINSNKEVVEETDTFDGTDNPIFYADQAETFEIRIAPLFEDKKNVDYSLGLETLGSDQGDVFVLIDKILSKFYRPDLPGACIGITQNGEFRFKKCYGMANMGQDRPNNEHTLFNLASVSKQFTGLAIAMLVAQGQLHLEDDVRTYIPELPEYGSKITLRHLLGHSSGLYENDFPLALAGLSGEAFISKAKDFQFVYSHNKLLAVPGDEFRYNNTGYVLLAEIVARVTNMPFSQWMKQNVFEPLGMQRAVVMDDFTAIIPGKAESYVKNSPDGYGVQTVNFDAPGPGNVYASMDDMGKWVSNFETFQVGGSEVNQLLGQRDTLNNGELNPYAFGNFISRFKGMDQVSHLGLTSGYRTALIRFPSSGLAIIYLGNNGFWNTYDLAGEIQEILLSDKIVREPLQEGSVGTNTTETTQQVQGTVADSSDYLGWYYSTVLQTTYRVVEREGVLQLEHFINNDIVLRPKAKDEFSTDTWFFAQVQFERGETGQVLKMIVRNDRDKGFFEFAKLH